MDEQIEQATAAPGELRELGHLDVLSLRDGDQLVFTAEGRVSPDAAAVLKARLEAAFPGRKVLVIEGGTLGAIRPE